MIPFKSKRKNKKRSPRRGTTIIVPLSKSECERRLFRAASHPDRHVRFAPQRTDQQTFYITSDLAWVKGELTEYTHSTRVRFQIYQNWLTSLAIAGTGLFMMALMHWAAKMEGKTVLWPGLLFTIFVMTIIPPWGMWLQSYKNKSVLRNAMLEAFDEPPDTTYDHPTHLHIIVKIFLYTSVLWSWLILLFDYVGFNIFGASGATLAVGLGMTVCLYILRYVVQHVSYRQRKRG